jgi:hypothetical protein
VDQPSDDFAERVGQTLEHEMTIVREAIAMVAGGGSPRVTVAGLHFGEALLVTARRLAIDHGVRVVPLWLPDDAGADIAVERIADD